MKILLKFSSILLLIGFCSNCSKDNYSEKDISILTDEAYVSQYAGLNIAEVYTQYYTLNIVGIDNLSQADLSGNNSDRIFIDLNNNNQIFLKKGDSFQVLDANAIDGRAYFHLPIPSQHSYHVFARVVSAPAQNMNLPECTEDPISGALICGLETEIKVSQEGSTDYIDITNHLLSIEASLNDINGDGYLDEGDMKNCNIFDEQFEGLFWIYDDKGQKLIQLRFYY